MSVPDASLTICAALVKVSTECVVTIRPSNCANKPGLAVGTVRPQPIGMYQHGGNMVAPGGLAQQNEPHPLQAEALAGKRLHRNKATPVIRRWQSAEVVLQISICANSVKHGF